MDRRYSSDADKKIDLIITVEGLARDFILKEGRNFSPQTPLLAILTSDTLHSVESSRRIVQIPSIFGVAETLEAALSLFPQTKRVFVVAGDGEDERRWEQNARNQLAPWFGKLDFEYSSGLTYEETLQRIGSLPPETIVLYIALYRDRTGRTFVPREVAIALSKVSNAPIFGLYDEILPLVVGGFMLSYGDEGARTAQLALDILKGNFSITQPLTTLPPRIAPGFNWPQLKRWGVRTDRLPKASIIVNRPTSIWDDYKGYVIGFLALIALQAGMIVALLEMNRRRKVAELNRKKAEERYRLIVETANEGILALDESQSISFANQKMLDMLGYKPEEMIGQSPDRFIYTEDLSAHHLSMEKRRLGQGETYERRFVCKNGKLIWVLASATPLLNDQGGIAGSFAMVTDVSERKQTEEALRESEERYRTAIEQSNDGVTLVKGDRHIFVNQRMVEIFGYDRPEEIIGKPIDMMVHPDDKERVQEINRRRQKGEAVHSQYEFKGQRKNGEPIYIEISASKTLYQGEAVSLVYLRDITSRKWAEEALRESEARFRSLVENAPEAIFIQTQRQFAYMNKAAVGLFGGISPDQFLGHPVINRIHPDYHEAVLERIRLLNEERKDIPPLEQKFLKLDGTSFDVEVSAVPFLYENQNGALVFFHDITERRQAEEEKRKLEERLQRAEKMEALGTLAGGVAHDLNNVLGIIVGYSELLLYDVEDLSPLRPGLVNILGGSKRAAAIVQDLLTLARRGVSSKQVLNLNKIIVDCQNSPEFENLSSYHPSVTIKADLEPDLLNISGSAVHLGKTLFNLLSNASEAMPKGGALTIKTSNQYLERPIQGYDEVREGDYVVLSVSDTGEGIPVSDLKRIFEPFYTKKAMGRSGTGLGLAVVWGTVKDHYGYINVQTEEQKGSTFTLYFPVTREEITAEDSTVSISEYLGKGETILIVDDVKGQRDLAAEMLKKLNYSVTNVPSGEEAVAYLEEHTVDLVILDMIMDPGMDGLDTYRSVLTIHPNQKAIIVSGFSETERVKAAQALGAGDYVKKPYVLEKLGMAVRKELDRAT